MERTCPTPCTRTPAVAPLGGSTNTARLTPPALSRNAAGQILAGIFALGLPGLALAAECANGSHITSSTSCTVPAGTLVTVEAWGGGGGGGAGSESNSDRFAGGGGGGGSYCKATFTSGGSTLSLNIMVGAGGTGGTSPAGGPLGAATAGGDSTVAGIGFIDMSAAGGTGGAVNATGSSAGGAVGGAACLGVATGTWVAGFAGGAGGHASAADVFGPGGSGGGGAAASDALAGNDGSAGDAGLPSEGGAGDFPGNDRGGGNGAQSASPSNLDAQPGVSPGGGGGGGMYSNVVEASRLGAAGAGGAVRLSWTPVPVGASPAATTGAATGITATGATLNGTVNDNGADTSVSFDHGASASYGSNAPATTGAPVLAGTGPSAVAAALMGLACNSTYHFRVMGSNSAGTTQGSDASFTTSACTTGPGVTTNAASSVGQTGATLNASVSDVGADVSGIAFEYGTTTAYGSTRAASTTSITASAGAPSSIAPTAALTSLSCGTTYHFRVKATDANATNNGSDATFTTSACSVDDSGGSTVISGGSGTINGGGSGTLTGPANVNVSGGNSTLDASSGSASGSTINMGPGSSTSVILGSGGQQVSVTSASSGATLGVVGGTTGSGSPNALAVSSGSAIISGGSGASLVTVNSGGFAPVTAGSGGASITATAMGSGSTAINVTSGSVTAPRNCGSRPTLPTTPPTGSRSDAWNTYFTEVKAYQRALLSYSLCISNARIVRTGGDASPVPSGSLLLYKGETIVYNSAGNETGITLADGGAGVPQALDFRRYGISLESLPVSIDGTPARLKGAHLDSAVVDGMGGLLGAALKRGPNTPVGGITMAAADGTQVTSVPVGPLRVSPGAAGGLQSSGLVRIVADGVVVDLAPSLASAGSFAFRLSGMDSQASVAIAANGVVKAAVGGATFVLWPAWAATPSSLNGFSFDSAGRLVFGDGRMQQTLYPAFANVDALAVALGPIAGTAALKMALDGSLSISIGGTGYRLRAGYQLTTTPTAHANDNWWLDGGTLYLNNHDGTAQPFTVE